jgi:catechol 2,3-dioxygenase
LGRVRLQVADLARSLAYYQRVLGLRVVEQTGPKAVLASEDDAPLVELHAVAGSRPSRGKLGLYHFAILLPERAELGRFLAHIAALGERVGSSNHLVSESVYLRDPDGLGIEVYADRPRESWRANGAELAMDTIPLNIPEVISEGGGRRWSAMPRGTTMGHVHLHVGDLDRAAAFYHAALGFAKMVWSYPGALFVAAGGYHHHLGLNTWAGPHAQPPETMDARLLDWEIMVPHADLEPAATSLKEAGFGTTPMDNGWRAADPWGAVVRVIGEAQR